MSEGVHLRGISAVPKHPWSHQQAYLAPWAILILDKGLFALHFLHIDEKFKKLALVTSSTNRDRKSSIVLVRTKESMKQHYSGYSSIRVALYNGPFAMPLGIKPARKAQCGHCVLLGKPWVITNWTFVNIWIQPFDCLCFSTAEVCQRCKVVRNDTCESNQQTTRYYWKFDRQCIRFQPTRWRFVWHKSVFMFGSN